MSIIISAAILAALVAADLLTKALICPTVIAAGGSMEFIPGLLRFVYLENTGMAFGQLQGFTVLLSIFTALACVAIGYIIVRYRSAMPALINLGLVMILAGALGNLYDRVFRGGVRDFVTFDFFSFPSFNFADSCITVGAVLLAVALIFTKSGRKFFMSLDDPDGKKNTDKKSGSDGSNKNDGPKDDSVNG